MTKDELKAEIAKWTELERLQLAEEIWREAHGAADASIPRAQVEESERRYDEYLSGRQPASEWSDVRRRIEAGR